MSFELSPLAKPEVKHGLKGTALFKENRLDKDILKAMDEDTYEEFVSSGKHRDGFLFRVS